MDHLLLALSDRRASRREDVSVARQGLSRHYPCRFGKCIYLGETRCLAELDEDQAGKLQFVQMVVWDARMLSAP
jgi:hypothetical protein